MSESEIEILEELVEVVFNPDSEDPTVVDSIEEIVEVLELGDPGPRGPSGPPGLDAGEVIHPAGTNISAGTCVYVTTFTRPSTEPDEAGEYPEVEYLVVLPASSDDLEAAGRIIGVAATSALANEPCRVRTFGPMTIELDFPRVPLFVGQDGVLTPDPETGLVQRQIATGQGPGITGKNIFVRVEHAIVRSVVD